MILSKLFKKKPDPALRLYAAIVESARQEKFYADMDVPDTLDGRFDMIVLHLFVVLQQLRGTSESLRQRVTDLFFKDLDRTLREMGVGDLSVAKKIRPMAEAFAGRLGAYHMAQEQGDLATQDALQRNVYAGKATPKAKALGDWLKQAQSTLATSAPQTLLDGEMNLL